MNEVIVSMQGISKSFPGVKALDDVHFELRSGEVMALLGENGAGKSTLVKILSGVYTRDSGTLEIFGKQYGDLNTKLAQEVGVAIIHQELNMCPHLTVAENMFLGREIVNGFITDTRRMEKEAAKILSDLNIEIDPSEMVGNLAVSKQQMVEIAKALSVKAKILIMDEPTSALTANEIRELFRIIKQLRAEGCGIVYISHRLDELHHIVDRVTIMRDGHYITSCNFEDTTMDEIISNMVGREIKEKFPRVQCQKGKKIFEVKNLNAGKMVKNVNLEAYEGEIIGIAGLMGAGRTETTRAIFGADPKSSGEIYLDGKAVTIRNPEDAIQAGIVLVPEDRRKDGLCTKLPIRENISLPNLDRKVLCNQVGVIDFEQENVMCNNVADNLKIKTASLEIDAGSLSGGNQQKIVVGKWLARESRVVIFDEPTRGIDVAAKVEIYNLMNQLKQQGIAVIFISSELPEILGIADRIIVMCDGRVVGEVMAEETTQEEILTLATKFESKLDDKAI